MQQYIRLKTKGIFLYVFNYFRFVLLKLVELDRQICDIVFRLFWASGVELPGKHPRKLAYPQAPLSRSIHPSLSKGQRW